MSDNYLSLVDWLAAYDALVEEITNTERHLVDLYAKLDALCQNDPQRSAAND